MTAPAFVAPYGGLRDPSNTQADLRQAFTAAGVPEHDQPFAAKDRGHADGPRARYLILVFLADSPDRACRVTALADATHTSQSRMSHALTSLEKRGWVRREKCTDDTRGI